MKRICYLFFAFVLFASCQKQLEIDFPKFQQKPVVSCLFSPNDNFKLRLTKTRSINDSTDEIISDAICIVYCDNALFDTLKYIGNGFYYINKKPSKGKTYSIKVITTEFDTVFAKSSIPDTLIFTDIQQKDFAVDDNENYDGDVSIPFSGFSFKINDPVSQKNYYELSIALKRNWDDTTYGNNYSMFVILKSFDPIIIYEDVLDYSPEFVPFSDSLFNGKSESFSFLYHTSWWSGGSTMNSYTYGKYRLYYNLRAISKEMYLYRKFLIKHIYNQQQSDDISIVGDPVQMWTNIQNGYGIFAGYYGTRDSIFVDESEFYF